VRADSPFSRRRNQDDHRHRQADRRHLACEPPCHLIVTFGAETSTVEVLLSGDGDQTLLKLTHSVPIELAGSAAGALYVGHGWDGALLGLGLYLAGEVSGRPVSTANSPEVQNFNVKSIQE
jgi:hypothetical protein